MRTHRWGRSLLYGYRKLTIALRRQYGLVINHKKVYRLCRELRMLRPQRAKKSTIPGGWPITGWLLGLNSCGKPTSNTGT